MKPVDVGDDSFSEYNGIAFNEESNETEVFMKKNCRKLIKKNLELKK